LDDHLYQKYKNITDKDEEVKHQDILTEDDEELEIRKKA